jgi:hypothetical protein
LQSLPGIDPSHRFFTGKAEFSSLADIPTALLEYKMINLINGNQQDQNHRAEIFLTLVNPGIVTNSLLQFSKILDFHWHIPLFVIHNFKIRGIKKQALSTNLFLYKSANNYPYPFKHNLQRFYFSFIRGKMLLQYE